MQQEILFNKGRRKVLNSKRCSCLSRFGVVFIETQQEIVYNTWQAVCSTSHIVQKRLSLQKIEGLVSGASLDVYTRISWQVFKRGWREQGFVVELKT